MKHQINRPALNNLEELIYDGRGTLIMRSWSISKEQLEECNNDLNKLHDKFKENEDSASGKIQSDNLDLIYDLIKADLVVKDDE